MLKHTVVLPLEEKAKEGFFKCLAETALYFPCMNAYFGCLLGLLFERKYSLS